MYLSSLSIYSRSDNIRPVGALSFALSLLDTPLTADWLQVFLGLILLNAPLKQIVRMKQSAKLSTKNIFYLNCKNFYKNTSCTFLLCYVDQSWVSTLKLREACPPHSSLSVPAYDRPHADGHLNDLIFVSLSVRMTSAWTLRPSWLAFSLFSRVWKSLTQLDWLLRPYHGPFVFMSWPHIWAFGLNLVKMKIW